MTSRSKNRAYRALLAPACALALAGALLWGCERPAQEDSAIERQILQEIAALRDDVDEIKDQIDELQSTLAEAPAAPAPARAAAPQPRTSRAPVQTAGFPALGSNDAPLTVVEFSDYQCPFCRRHSTSTLPQLKKDFVDTGKVRYVFVDFPIPSHRYAAKAAEAARCAGDQDKYWAMHDHLFANQHRIQPDNFAVFAKELALDEAAFTTCMESGKHVSEVEAARRVASAAGATATPTFVVGKTTPDGNVSGELIIGAKGYSVFQDRLNQLLAN